MTRRFLLGVLAMGYSRGVIAVIQLLLVPILALSWGLPLYGQWLMLASVPVFLGASDFGFGTTAGMRIIGEIARGSVDEALITYRSALRMILLLACGMLVLAAVTVALVPDRLLTVHGGMAASEARTVLALLVIYTLLMLQSPLLIAIARAMGKTAQTIALEATTQLVEGMAAIVIALAGGSPVDVAIAYLGLRATGVIALYLYARKVAPWLAGDGSASALRIRAMWRPALAAMALPLSQAGYLQGSALAVGAAGGAPLVPVYTSLRTLSRLGYQVALMVAIPLLPEYAAARARHDDRRSALILGGVGAVVLLMGVGYALVMALFGTPLLAAWTRGAIAPPHAMIVLTAVAAGMGIVWTPMSDMLLAINRHEAFAYIYMACAAIATGLAFVLVRALGVTGAAGANLLLEFTMLVTVAILLRRHGGPIEQRPRTLLAAWPRIPNKHDQAQ